MTPEAQRIAIAEVCGWQDIKENVHVGGSGEASSLAPVGKICNGGVQYVLPDYLNDLNAMHEAVMALTPEQLAYYEQLMITKFGFTKAITTTAAEQAKQFLKATNLWTD